MQIKKPNYYNFNHEGVSKKFEGGLTFVNEFCVKGEYVPVAVYRAEKPNKKKGHKKYMLLQMESKGGLVRGMTEEEIGPFRHQTAIHCLDCDTVIYSVHRHTMEPCVCGKVYIDGGRDYTKVNYSEEANFKMVTLDLLTDTIFEIIPTEGEDK